MYKVLIADDETKVTQLIQSLIKWEQLNLELLGVAHDGVKALEMIELYNPDIVITDIRMPGYDGIELIKRAKAVHPSVDFIIISGYQHFDYAHNAIKYDVKDYLLKPLKEEEINRTLSKMVDRYDTERERDVETDILIKRLKKDQTIIQSDFSERFFSSFDQSIDNLTVDSVKESYFYNFNRQFFRLIAIKPDIQISSGDDELLKLLIEKSENVTKRLLQKAVSDMISKKCSDRVLVMINYDSEDRKTIRQAFMQILEEVTALRDLFHTVNVTVALSDEVESWSDLKGLKDQAERRWFDKVLASTSRLIDSDSIERGDMSIEEYLNDKVKDDFVQAIRELDIQKFKRHFDDWVLTLSLSKTISGQAYFNLGNSIRQLTVGTLVRFEMVDENFIEQNTFNETAYYMERSVMALMQYNYLYLETLFESAMELRKKRNRGPIDEALGYMEANYSEGITLDQVSELVGFNTSYFSTLFKKETGINFLEYLTSVRIKQAKIHLADGTLSVAAVAEMCGYSDVKHFAKQFKKHTGLTPAKYRKLYF